MNTNRSFSMHKLILLIAILILLVVSFGCFGEKAADDYTPELAPTSGDTAADDYTGDFASPLEVKLSLSNAPSLNQTAMLACKCFSRFGTSDIIFQVYLPEGLALIDGDVSWQGSLAENEGFELKATVKAVKTGIWTIEAFAKKQQPQPGFTLDRVGQMGKLYLSISKESAVISEWPFESETPPEESDIQISKPEKP